MVRSQERPLTSATLFKHDAQAILRAAMAAVSPDRLIERALEDPAGASGLSDALARGRYTLLAAGKAAAPMAAAWLARVVPPRAGLVVGTHRGSHALGALEWQQGGHPVPTEGSLQGARDALALARRVGPDEPLVVLLSGGASAAMALPLPPVSLEDKRQAVSRLLRAGADIQALNTVRKHLSAIKGGRLAAACDGMTVTFAVSDVVGDDPGVIGSGPTVADPTFFAEAQAVVRAFDVADQVPVSVLQLLESGARGEVDESVKPGDPRLARASWRMIGGRRDAMEGARAEGEARGYQVIVLDEPVVGDAREAATAHVRRVRQRLATVREVARPVCVVSSGETTVRVVGEGRGGRNQEFVLAAALALEDGPAGAAVASAGTDGIDGPTDAAGAVADVETLHRAGAAGLDPASFQADNDTYRFFAALGDLVMTGPTDTNVGDVQVVLVP